MVFRLWILLGSIGLVLGQGSSERYDILRGTRGEPACTLQVDVINCPLLTRRDSILSRDTTISPAPSTCTCNTIFFNIWSACCYSTGNNTMPNFTEWAQECTKSGKQIESSPDLQRNLGVDIPTWATLMVPSGNTTFDLQKAVALSLPIRWTPLQRMLPVATVIMTLLVSGAVLLFCRWSGGRTPGWTKGMKRLQAHGSHKVTINFDKGDNWKIDEEDDPPMKDQLFVNFAPSADARVSPDPEQTDVHGSDKKPKTILNSTSTNPFKVPTPSSVRIPWKRRPPQIKLVPATSRFRVDSDVDKSICSASGEANPEKGENGMAGDDEEQPADDQYVSPENEEAENLITPTEREERNSQEVFLISNNGRPFTIDSRSTNTVSVDSHIKIISPSVSSASRCSAPNATPTRPTLHIPISPPPSHPPPAPPITSRRAERPGSSDKGPSLEYFLPPSFLPPIREASPSQLYSPSSLRRSAAIIRRPSNPESIHAIHMASPAVNPSPNLGTSNIRLPHYIDLHRTESQRSDFSLANAENEEVLYDPYLDSNGNRYGTMFSGDDGSDESFYCTSPEPLRMQPHAGVTSPSTTDPAAFFPGPVRAAGYPIMTYT